MENPNLNINMKGYNSERKNNNEANDGKGISASHDRDIFFNLE